MAEDHNIYIRTFILASTQQAHAYIKVNPPLSVSVSQEILSQSHANIEVAPQTMCDITMSAANWHDLLSISVVEMSLI